MRTFAAHCLGRMGFGARITNSTNEIDAFNALGVDDDARLATYLTQQMDWQNIDDSAFATQLANAPYVTLDKPLATMWQDHHVDSTVSGFNRDAPAEEMERLIIARGVHSKRQLLEVLADFWHNHFNIFSRDYYAQSTFSAWDRDVIRPPTIAHPRPVTQADGHLFGNFRQMLELSSKHIAMSHYLDNYINKVGSPNENFAREIIELHTLGAENYVSLGDPNSIPKTSLSMPWGNELIADSYVDDDVYSAMRMLTGWKVKDYLNGAQSNFQDNGEFFYYSPWHDKFEKTILGYHWGNFEPDPNDIERFFDILAYHPGTAAHIAGKLCRRFISDNPPQTVIDAVADAFYQNRYAGNQLELVYQALFLSAEFKNPANFGKKKKRPIECMISTLRTLNSDFFAQPDDNDTNTLIYFLHRSGQRPFYWPAPDGYPDDENYWLGGNSMMYTLRAIDWIVDRNYASSDRIVDVLTPALTASVTDLPSHSPNDLTSFWLHRILGYEPSGGWLGQSLHSKLRDFMRQNPNDPQQWPENTPFPDISSTSSPNYVYERMRGLIKLILSSPEFMYR